MENLTLSSFTGIQKEGQRPVFKYIRYSPLLFSFPWRRSEGKLENPGALALELPWWPYKEVYAQKLKGRSLLAKNKSRKGDLWNRTATFLKVSLGPTFSRWRQQLLRANCHVKIPQNKNTIVHLKKVWFFFLQIIPFSAKQRPLEQSPAPTANELRGQKVPSLTYIQLLHLRAYPLLCLPCLFCSPPVY